MAIQLKRRALLKGAGGAALALPMLEFTHAGDAKAGGNGIPNRYVFIYCGMSAGRDGAGTMLVPTQVGPGYDLPRSLWPLGNMALPYGGNGFDVQDEVSVVTGLTIPWGGLGETPPPGGKSPEFHYNTVGPLVSGVRGESTRTGFARGPSSDQIVAPFIADASHRHLVYRVQPVRYVGSNGGGGDAGRVSWRDNGGSLEAVESNASPRLAFESLFSTFVPPDDTLALAALERRRKVLDMLRAKTASLVPQLGAADKIRMEQHFDEIKALESRVDAITDVSGACQPPPDPGEDPPLGDAHATGADGNLDYTESAGYSDEETRAEVMFDLVHEAFACDQARVAAVRMTFDQCFVNALPLIGATSDVHELSHGATAPESFADACGWHVKHFARLVAKLRDTQEFDGSTMLDHTAVVLVFEGGYGYDPEGDSGDRAHSTENMVAMVAGRVGGLVGGQHIVAPGAHPASVTLSAMQAVGAEVAALGEIGSNIPGLFG
jgi:hypothetical protein